MKVAELEGALLDYWVAKAEGLEIDSAFEKGLHPHLYVFGDGDLADFAPSSNWGDGGPLIERGLISLLFLPADSPDRTQDRWEAFTNSEGPSFESASPLVAAMRAHVASKFGDDVPDINA